jgi:hypothetical protein
MMAYGLEEPERRRIRAMLVVSFILTTLAVRGIVGRSAALALETLSVVTWGALVALAALLYLRARVSARAAAGGWE